MTANPPAHDAAAIAEIAVIQADRDMAASIMRSPELTHVIREGGADSDPVVQTFALHRINCEATSGDLAGYLTYDEDGLNEEFSNMRLTDADLEAGCTQKPVYFCAQSSARAHISQAKGE